MKRNGFKKTAVIIPAYNEEKAIGRVISKVKEVLPYADVIVIIDESTDRTEEIAIQLGAIVLRLPLNMGMGCAVQTGFKYASRNGYEFVIRMDSDGQHIPEEIEKLFSDVLSGKTEVAIGSRFLELGDYPVHSTRRSVMKILAYTVSKIYGKRFTDTTSGFLAMNRKVAKFLSENFPPIGGTPTLILLKWGGFAVSEVAVKMRERQGGISYLTNARKLAYMFRVFVALLAFAVKKKNVPSLEEE